MTHLLDVNVLLAAIVATHSKHPPARAWLRGKVVAVSPISQLGFLRIGANPRAVGLTMAQAREALDRFLREHKVEQIADDLAPLASRADKWDLVTDHYLADLASKHGLKLATFDAGIKHPSSELVS